MNTKRLFFIAAAIVLTACTELEKPTESNVPVTLSYSTSAVGAVETKAAQDLNEGAFASDESVKVRISNTGACVWTDYDFTTGDAGAMTPPNPGPYYPAGSQNIDIVAYYPATASTTFTVASDQTADADYKASDLMFASVTNQAKQANAVTLVFSHKMAKLCVNITAGSGVSSINSLSVLNVKPTVSFDQATGEVGEVTGDATTIAMSNNGAAVIPAQTIDGGLLSIVTDMGTATYSVSNKSFAAGKLYTINITVNLRAVGTTTEISGWTSEGTVTVNPVAKDKTPVGVEAVDMGHPGGVKWANMNLGARSVTDYGYYIAWGATFPFRIGYNEYGVFDPQYIGGKTAYDWANYPFMQPGENSCSDITKYTFDDGWYDYDDDAIWYDSDGKFIGDGKRSFADYDYVDDAARQIWGGGWRTPTDAEWAWLCKNCTWTMNELDGGCLVEAKNGNSIFLPAAGYLDDGGEDGYYWSSSLSKEFSFKAICTYFNTGFPRPEKSDKDRCFGLSIRPVIGDVNLTTPGRLEAVDMGNGLKWANMNVGAEFETDYGDYFAWGATKPFYVNHDAYGNEIPGYWNDGKTAYDWANYPFMQSGQSGQNYITKYTFADENTDGIWYDSEGKFIGDGKTSFADYDYADDAARQNWGGGWRTPTYDEWHWLVLNCTWTWTEDYLGDGSNRAGRIVTSKVNGNTIFLPAAGWRQDNSVEWPGTFGEYWSSSLSGSSWYGCDSARSVEFLSDGIMGYEGTDARCNGLSVRPVMD